jgi:hypothetical protein
MKKFWYLCLFIGILSVSFVSCGKDDDPADDNNGNAINSTVRYEASVSDAVNYKLRVAYVDETGAPLKEEIVESPWSYEMKNLKKGAYLYISTIAVPRNDLITPDKVVTSKIYIGGKLHEEKTGEFSAIVQYILGTP